MIERYEGDTPGGEQLAALGMLPEGWMDTEFNDILAHGWDTFLCANDDPALNRLADVEHTQIFPAPAGSFLIGMRKWVTTKTGTVTWLPWQKTDWASLRNFRVSVMP